MAEEIPLEVLEGQYVIRKWIDSLPKLGYVHAFQIPTDREDLLDAVKKGWNLNTVFIKDGYENKISVKDFASITIGEVIPIFQDLPDSSFWHIIEVKPSGIIHGLNLSHRINISRKFSTFTHIIPRRNRDER